MNFDRLDTIMFTLIIILGLFATYMLGGSVKKYEIASSCDKIGMVIIKGRSYTCGLLE